MDQILDKGSEQVVVEAAAILIDATIVRAGLLPATIKLLEVSFGRSERGTEASDVAQPPAQA